MSKSKDTDLTATLDFEGVERQPLRTFTERAVENHVHRIGEVRLLGVVAQTNALDVAAGRRLGIGHACLRP